MLQKLMEIFPQYDAGFRPGPVAQQQHLPNRSFSSLLGFGSPYRHGRRPSKSRMQREKALQDLAERLHHNSFVSQLNLL